MIEVTVRALVVASLLLAPAVGTQARASLFERLGGSEGLTNITNDLVERSFRDPKIGHFFADSDLKRVKTMLYEQLCQLSEGPCRYTGDSMREVHAGHHIAQGDFYHMVENLRSVLQAHQVRQGDINELLKRLAPMKRDIVEPPARGAPP